MKLHRSALELLMTVSIRPLKLGTDDDMVLRDTFRDDQLLLKQEELITATYEMTEKGYEYLFKAQGFPWGEVVHTIAQKQGY